MTRNLKALGIALAAAFAVYAVAASAAYATSAHVRCDEGKPEKECTIQIEAHPTEKGTQRFKVPAIGTIECTIFDAHAIVPETASVNVTLTPTPGPPIHKTYEGCTVGGLGKAEVNFHEGAGPPTECHFTLTAPLTTATSEPTGHATGGVILGPAGCEVTITTTKPEACTITVKGEQSFPEAITYTSVKTPEKLEELTIHAEVKPNAEGKKGIKYSYVCTLKKGEGEDGSYEGTLTARGFTEGVQKNLTVVDT
jgi:hypothetical protein